MSAFALILMGPLSFTIASILFGTSLPQFPLPTDRQPQQVNCQQARIHHHIGEWKLALSCNFQTESQVTGREFLRNFVENLPTWVEEIHENPLWLNTNEISGLKHRFTVGHPNSAIRLKGDSTAGLNKEGHFQFRFTATDGPTSGPGSQIESLQSLMEIHPTDDSQRFHQLHWQEAFRFSPPPSVSDGIGQIFEEWATLVTEHRLYQLIHSLKD